ncbi:MAG: T9SS type A sorting domain-containing protein [Calditrichae bacterium]|nr:T9SS type A sorting domain-containing protein [Calditrichia bacterium]
MSSRVLGAIIGLAVYLLASSSYAQTTIDQALAVVLNDKTVGGNFQIQLRVKGTNLPAANTLGSATVDITYDNTKLTFVNSTVWSFGTSLGYTRSATNNTTFVRVLVTGSGVNEDGGGNPPGFDITGTYVTWVQLNFTIDDATGTTDLTIDGTSNAIGLFENYQNEPNTGVINDQPLSDPEELIDISLPVELALFQAAAAREEVTLTWVTESEVNNLGFEVLRSVAEDSGYVLIASYETDPALSGQGNSNAETEYRFSDRSIEPGNTYWYKIADIDYNGNRFHHPPVSVTVELPLVPDQFFLGLNYPNPFNPNTRVEFGVPEQDQPVRIVLAVYDILGRRVAKLVDRKFEPGYHQVNWDGRNDSDQQLASGIYFLRLESKRFVKTRKMILLR